MLSEESLPSGVVHVKALLSGVINDQRVEANGRCRLETVTF